MKPVRNIIRYVLTTPMFFGWLFPLLTFVLYMSHELRVIDNKVLSATWRPWAAKIWKYSTTLGRGMVLQPDAGDRILDHEMVHVRQFEDATLLALIVSLLVTLVTWNLWWLLLWASGPLWLSTAYLGAVMRGGRIYRDAEIERSAYAQTDTFLTTDNTSWLDAHQVIE